MGRKSNRYTPEALCSELSEHPAHFNDKRLFTGVATSRDTGTTTGFDAKDRVVFTRLFSGVFPVLFVLSGRE